MADGVVNGRDVTLAVLGEKIDALAERFDKLCDDIEPRVRNLEGKAIEHDQKLGMFAGVQTFISLVFSALAAWIGSRT